MTSNSFYCFFRAGLQGAAEAASVTPSRLAQGNGYGLIPIQGMYGA